VLLEGVIGMGTQLGKQGRFLLRSDGRSGTTPVGGRGETPRRRLPPQVAAHRALADRETAGGLGATAAAFDRPHNPFA
jgi:hypothetical protein